MNIIKMNEKPQFPSIESKVNKWITFVLRTTLFGILLLFSGLFIFGPLYGLYKKGMETMLYPTIACWIVSLPIIIFAIRYYILRRKKIACTIVVNHSGLLFYNQNHEVMDKILYAELRPSKQNFDIYTATSIGSGIVPLLEVTLQDGATRRVDMNLPLLVVKNKFSLYAHFLQGITVFRPDLKIDPMVLTTYSIDPKTWKVNGKGVSLMAWMLILLALIAAGIIVGLVFLLT